MDAVTIADIGNRSSNLSSWGISISFTRYLGAQKNQINRIKQLVPRMDSELVNFDMDDSFGTVLRKNDSFGLIMVLELALFCKVATVVVNQ